MLYLLVLIGFLIGQEAVAETVTPKACPAASKACLRGAKSCPSWWSQGWAVTVYSGPLTSQTTSKIPSDPDFEGSTIIVGAVAKKLGSVWNKKLDFELEAQYVQHFGGQTHVEINPAVFVMRWNDFVWNKTLPTTIAIGDGLSIATKVPALELSRRGSEESTQVLNYVMAEITFSLLSLPQWAVVARYHHRSGVFGLYNGVHDASTAFAAGLKYWF